MGKRKSLGSQRSIRSRRVEEPKMPPELSPEAEQEWRRVTGLLRERTALDALDETALIDYLTCWIRLRECEADVAARGVLVEGGGGRGKVKNPACQLARQYRDHLIAWCKEFGFTPGSRSRIELPPPEEPNNPWAHFAR